MSRLYLALIVILGLSGCRNPQQPELRNRSSRTSHIQELLAAPGGPRVVTLYLGGGDIEALPDANDRSKSIPGFVSVSGIRVTEGNKRTIGVTISLSDSTCSDKELDRKTSRVISMDANEASELKNAINQEINYVFSSMKNPPKHEGDMEWHSVGGFSISASSDVGNAPLFTVSAPDAGADSGSILLSLSLNGGRKLIADVDNALNTANGED